MANQYRIYFDVWSAQPEALRVFLGTLISDGWYGHVPVPVRNCRTGEGGDDIITAEIDAWGAYLFPDMRILTRAGLVEVGELGSNLPHFDAKSIDERIACLSDEHQPGFMPPNPTDHFASIIAESRGGIPFRWFVNVIDQSYDQGLRIFAVAFDSVNASYGTTDGVLFYSAPSESECGLHMLDGRSEHCIGLTVPDYIQGCPDEPEPELDDPSAVVPMEDCSLEPLGVARRSQANIGNKVREESLGERTCEVQRA